MAHDVLNRPYLYVANKEMGLTIYNISNPAAPVFVSDIGVAMTGSLQVMNLWQDGNYLYLALGNHFTNPQQGGMAIVNVTNPVMPVVTDYYVVPNSASGAGIVRTEGNYAYLGAMKSGLVILDITNKSSIQFVSQYVPDLNYPVANPNANLYNARGMEVRNNIVYLCYDAGGLRIINCVNKLIPVETGHYANPALHIPFNLPRAYNNIVLNGNLAYVAVDYCGMEILDVSDTSNITLTGWWNPYNCPNNNWFSSPVHANEIQYDPDCNLVFLSTGKSDAMVIDVSNPSLPDSCNFYGGVNNNIGTWGIGRYHDQLYLSYICTLGIPFASNWTGVKVLTYTPCPTAIDDKDDIEKIDVFPNPFCDIINISFSSKKFAYAEVEFSVNDVAGRTVSRTFISDITGNLRLDLSELQKGMYFLEVKNRRNTSVVRLIKI